MVARTDLPTQECRTESKIIRSVSSHENLNQFSAQRLEKHALDFNSKLSEIKRPAAAR